MGWDFLAEYVMHIDFIDRPGLGYEIFKLTEIHHIDKIAMEVLPRHGMVIKFRCDSRSQTQQLIDAVIAVGGVKSAKIRDQMPYEEREDELRTILNSVSDGILAVDKDGKITHINEVACKIMHVTSCEVLGLSVEEVVAAPLPLLNTLKTGQTYKLKEQRMKKGTHVIHYLTSVKPIMNDKGQIIGAVATLKDFRQVEEIMLKVDKIRRITTFDDIVYQSQVMNQIIQAAQTVAQSSSTILLRGESGTGKELFASAIHAEGPRHHAAFIAVNCAALPETLLESELFGYEEGAFTGAVKGGKRGFFEQANGGTLFLDEIGEISPQVQVKLLRVLQEGIIRRVGGHNEILINVRIIAATHRNLEEMVRSGHFREDLYYRLNVIPLVIPPLRERKQDIPLLAQHLIRKICVKLDKPEVRLSRESLALLIAQTWPGNVRQLENVLERLINFSDSTEITPSHIVGWSDITILGTDAGRPLRTAKTLQIEIPDGDEWPRLKDIVAEVEKDVIRRVIKKYPSSRLAGQVLGVSNTTILNKMRTYRI
jgi:TyrR family helix-turn-helix protein/PAS domain S-box-containing protein